MTRSKAYLRPKLVWRITAQVPNGSWVDPSEREHAAPSPVLIEVGSGSRVMSSFDLLRGADIDEDANADTIPAQLFDELFGPPKQARVTTKK
jgi:hypothetical protein